VLKKQILPGNCLVEADYSGFARMFEKAMLKMDKLTPHQESKLSECLEDGAKRVHIVAPAGAGKTFLALHLIIKFLQDASEEQDNDGACVLFVAKNRALAFFVAKWLHAREHGSELLQRLYLLYEPFDQLQPHKVANNGWKLVADRGDPLPARFGMVCIDEAHHLFGMADHQNATSLLDKFCSQDDVRLVLLSDISQSRDKTIKYPPGLRKVELTEVVRNSERIVLAASAFQLQEDNPSHMSTSCKHGVTGPPLVSRLFDEKSEPGSPEHYDAYAKHIAKAFTGDIASKFRGLILHDRVAILVPNDLFRAEMAKRLPALLQGNGSRKFKLVSADEASEAVPSDDMSTCIQEEWLVLETMDKFDGLERLIVMVVGMDQSGAAIKGRNDSVLLQTRSLLYRAVTRAHMFVCVVNAVQKEGLLSFLMHVKLEADGAKSSKAREVVPLTAQALVDSTGGEQVTATSAGDNHQEAPKLEAQESHSSTVRHVDIDAYVLDKERRSKETKTGKKKRMLIANNLWDTSGNYAANVPAALPDFMPFDLGGLHEQEEGQEVSLFHHQHPCLVYLQWNQYIFFAFFWTCLIVGWKHSSLYETLI
jgi:hypothetical protein